MTERAETHVDQPKQSDQVLYYLIADISVNINYKSPLSEYIALLSDQDDYMSHI